MKRKLKRIGIIVLSILGLLTLSFFIYTSIYYHADEVAKSLLEKDQSILQENNVLSLPSNYASDTALIFYPGAKVEAISYLPLLERLREEIDINIYLVEMPFNLAVLNPNAATSIIDSHPEIKHWIISGHSMGGAMASSYASQYSDKVDGLILLGAYIYGDYPQEKALTIYGSLNTSVQEKIDYTENIIVIEGGNHAQFGNYGSQKGDAVAQISQLDQQEIAISAMVEFIGDLK